jgi:hypothetical protein
LATASPLRCSTRRLLLTKSNDRETRLASLSAHHQPPPSADGDA